MGKMKKVTAFLLALTVAFAMLFGNIPGLCTEAEAASKVWNGKADTSWYSSDLDYFEISTANELAGLAKLVNEGTSFSGCLIELRSNIALNKTNNFSKWDKKAPKNKWEMIGSKEHPFRGTFNGNGHTITGMYIKDTETYSNWYNVWYANGGLFGYLDNATIVNLKMNNAFINVKGTMGTVAAFSENSNFYGIEVNKSTLLSGYAGGIVGEATYDWSDTLWNLLTVVAMEGIMMSAGLVLNPLVFGDAVFLPKDFQGNIFFSCKVNGLTCKDTKTTGGIVALGGDSDDPVGLASCLVTNYKVTSNGTKGVFMGIQPSSDYAILQNCYSYNAQITKNCDNKTFIDMKSVKKLTKKKLYSGKVSKLGKAFEQKKGKMPQLKMFIETKKVADEDTYRIIEDGWYYINYDGYWNVNSSDDIVRTETPQKFYFAYRDAGYYTITDENGNILTGCNDDIYVQHNGYNEHRFTQRWILENRGDSYYIKLKQTGATVGLSTGFLWQSARGIYLEEDEFLGGDEQIGYSFIWSITPAE